MYMYSYMDAFTHSWANPKKIENELSVPIERNYA